MKRNKVTLGTISHATMREEDLIPAFVAELRRIRGALPKAIAQHFAAWESLNSGACRTREEADAMELCADLIDALNEYAPDYCYFGAHPGDGSDYGFWLSEDWEQQARDDGVLFVGDLSEIDAPVNIGHRGLVCHVNDHGNATLYRLKRNGCVREVWSVV